MTMAEESVCYGFQTTEEAGVDSHKPTVPIVRVRKNVFCFSFCPPFVDARLSCSSLHTCSQRETGWMAPSVCLTVRRGWAVALSKEASEEFSCCDNLVLACHTKAVRCSVYSEGGISAYV